MHIDNGSLGALIKRARLDKGYTQDTLAEMVGLGSRQIAAIEKGESKTRYANLEKLIQVLDISADAIFRPEALSRAPDQEQAINEFLRCSADEQRIIAATMRCMIKEMRKGSSSL
jgi:transcriptional regulator with XRE-family HTH domain